MASLQEIPGVGPDQVAMLQAAGIERPADLAAVPAERVRHAIEETAGEEGDVPSEEEILAWQQAVRSMLQPAPRAESHDRLPVAQTVPARQLMESGIPVSSVPIAQILEEAQATLPARNLAPAEDRTSGPKPARVRSPQIREVAPAAYRSKPAPSPRAPTPHVPRPFLSTEERSRADEDFQRKNHGMTHKDPGHVRRGALATVVAGLLVLTGVVTIVAALVMEFSLHRQIPLSLAWGLLSFPLALVVFVIGASGPRCRLCGQKIFMPQRCAKHVRAHRSPLGYVMTLALHALFRGWFRCSLCGTKQVLK